MMSTLFLTAQSEQPIVSFQTITTEQGLSNNFVFAISQDSFGFVWIGTTNGLCRFDSEDSFTIYNKDNSELRSNNIRALLADSQNRLWIGTRLGGLSCYNLIDGTWKTYLKDLNDVNSLSNNEVLSLKEDSKGRIWVGTEVGINLFLPETDNFKNWLPNGQDKNAICSKAVLSIEEDSRGFIWFGLWEGGLNLILNTGSENPDDYIFRNFSFEGNLSANNVWKILSTTDDRIWIGSHGGGIFVINSTDDMNNDPKNQDWKLNYISINNSNNKKLEGNIIDDIIEDKKGDLWIATTNGLHHISSSEIPKDKEQVINPSEVSFDNYKINNKNESIPSNVVNKIMVSKEGLIWVGTISGLSYFETRKNLIDFYEQPYLSDVNYLNDNFAIQDSIMWTVKSNNELVKYLMNERKSITVQFPEIETNTKMYALKLIENNVLLICSNKGLIEYNIKTKAVKEYRAPIEILEKSNGFLARYIFVDKEGLIYISTEFGLITFDKVKNKFHFHRTASNDESTLSDNSITQIFEDSNEDIWIATYKGLNKLLEKKGDKLIFKRFLNKLGDSQLDLKSNQILTLTELNKILYIGTTNGISTMDIRTESVAGIEIPKSGNYIISIEKDIYDNLWFSTTEGINYYDNKEKSINKFNLKDGLYDLGFRLMTSHSDKDGYVYFGSQHGVARINSNFKNIKAEPPRVFITEAKTINNKNQEIKNVFNTNHIELDANNYYLELKFVGLAYNRIEDSQYAYKLEGLDDDWFYTNKMPSAVYTNLKPGKYTFKAKAANYQGLWSEEEAQLTIEKKPALIQTKWFQILTGLITIFLIWFILRNYTRNIKKNNQILKNFNTSLNDEIEERMKVEKDLLQTNKDLQQFAYSASHDLQEPLRNIGNAVGLLKRKNEFDNNSNEYVEIAVDGVKRMSSLIQNLLNYAKTGSNDIVLEECNLNMLLKDKLKDLSILIVEKNANVLIKDLPTIFCESNQLGVVFYNLLNNAIKFNDKKNPEVEIGLSGYGPVDKYQFYVKDNGLGINPEYQNRIFTMFTRLENKRDYEGTGIGLTLCQKIVTRHNGTIWVSSAPEKGSTFFFTIDKNLNK